MWLETYLQGGKNNYYNYLANKQFPDSDVDGFLVMMAAFYLGKVITVVSNAGVLSTEKINHDIVLLHLGGQTFMDTGKKFILIKSSASVKGVVLSNCVEQ